MVNEEGRVGECFGRCKRSVLMAMALLYGNGGNGRAMALLSWMASCWLLRIVSKSNISGGTEKRGKAGSRQLRYWDILFVGTHQTSSM